MTDIKKRHFCKSVALLSLVPLLKIDFLSANTNVQNSVLSGSVMVNGKKVSKNSDLDFDQITDVETGNQLSLIKNDQDGFLVRPNSKLVFYKNKIRELVQGSIHGVFGEKSDELKITSPRGTIGIRGTVTYIEHVEDKNFTYVCNCYGTTAVYSEKNKLLKTLDTKYHSPLIITQENKIAESPYNIPLNHYDDNILNIENALGRKPRWELPNGKMLFLAPDKEKFSLSKITLKTF